MSKWEYLDLLYYLDSRGEQWRWSDTTEIIKPKQRLNRLGALGWELVSVQTTGRRSISRGPGIYAKWEPESAVTDEFVTEMKYTFKRPGAG